MGSATAWQLVRHGADVVLLEQFGPGHTRGSSHGSSRIVRLSYADPFYVDLAAAAYQRWTELEADAGEQLLTWTGVVDHGEPAPVQALAELLSQRTRHGVLEPAAAMERWPGLRFESPALFHPRGGRVHADRTVAALNGPQLNTARMSGITVGSRRSCPLRQRRDTNRRRHRAGEQRRGRDGGMDGALLADVTPLPRLTVTRGAAGALLAVRPGDVVAELHPPSRQRSNPRHRHATRHLWAE